MTPAATLGMIEQDGTFTLRDRDSMEQKRITESELMTLLDEAVY